MLRILGNGTQSCAHIKHTHNSKQPRDLLLLTSPLGQLSSGLMASKHERRDDKEKQQSDHTAAVAALEATCAQNNRGTASEPRKRETHLASLSNLLEHMVPFMSLQRVGREGSGSTVVWVFIWACLRFVWVFIRARLRFIFWFG